MWEKIAIGCALLLMAALSIGTIWLSWHKSVARMQDREDQARAIRARGLLNLSDKQYMIPKQDNWQIRNAVANHRAGRTVGVCINHRCTIHLISMDEETVVIKGKREPKERKEVILNE